MATNDVRTERLKKLALMKEVGMEPYPAESARTHSNADFLLSFDTLANANTVTLCGRIMSLRDQGGLIFIDLFDGTAKVQAIVKKDEIGDTAFDQLVSFVSVSDFVEITGNTFVTKRGMNSLLATAWRMITKSLNQIPDEWFGLKDEDERYRHRYIDMLLNPEVADIVRMRSLFWNTIRQYLLTRNFIEVETPVLENTTGGADARPFSTHHNALDIDVFLRISAGELWQKKLLVGGFPKVFEIGRIFRNEGMSREHLQDYTQLEFYIAYADYIEGMKIARELYLSIAQTVFGTTTFEIFGHTVNLADDWRIYRYSDVLKEHYNIDPLETSVEAIVSALTAAEIPFEARSMSIERGVDLLWKKVRKTISGPGFLVGVPVYLEPLAKRSREDGRVVERFQILLAGSEMGKGFSELNDPVDQRERFVRQQELRDAGDDEAQMADMDFVEALEYGMPPAFGFGVSERLFSFLCGIDVREGQIFPLMRPKN